MTPTEPTPQPDQPDQPQPDDAPKPEEQEGEHGDGPSSHETAGQFPADEVADTFNGDDQPKTDTAP